MNKSSVLAIVLMISIISCKKSPQDGGSILNTIKDSTSTLISLSESDYRPGYHFTPPLHWMNDPNGLVYYKGTYNLFYQYNPNGNVWGPMNWGHATSADLFNWKDQPVAISPDATGTIFSGSAVVDAGNTSGFKTGTEDPLVAIYTLNGSQQQQSIAYSNDGGFNWTKFASNPVLPNPGVNDFRDPKVFWYAPGSKWVMVLAVGNKVQLYSSADLKSWVFLSEFGANIGAHGGVWECPDLFQMPVEGTALTKWVLVVSVNPGGPNGGSATQYFVGDFDGTKFTNSNNEINWMDYGTDNYAGATYNNISNADGRRISVGWMSNWNYAQQVPTTSWRSTMTVPRVLSLATSGTGYVMKSKPVDELANYELGTPDTSVLSFSKSVQMLKSKIIASGSYEINFTADLNSTATLSLSIGNTLEKVMISFDKASNLITVDRGASGIIDFSSQFAGKIICPYVPKSGQTTSFQMLVDKTSIELFVDNGERAITAIYFPRYQYNFLKLQGDGSSAVISNFTAKEINKSLR